MIAIVRRLALAALVLALPAIAAAQTYTISPPPFLLAQNNSGAIVNNACIWTYAAGTTTPATTYTTSTGTANSNPIRPDPAGRFTAFLAPGTAYKFVYESACTPPGHGTTLRTADNISAMPASAASVDITGTAGESITAGQAVYLSDGSGSKTPGQWYKADSANAYSSTTNYVGIATVNIASAGTGTIRLAGAVTGLTVSVGLKYYAGAAGALTSTAPANARLLGEADSATSLVLTGNPPASAVVGFVDDFRLSLTTATCVPASDVTAATTVFLTPCSGNRITLLDSAGTPSTYTTAELSIAVPATTSQVYDVWVFANSGVPTLELLAWTNDTTRATAISRSSGIWTKTGDTTRRFVGSFRTTGVSGQTEDSKTKRHVCNAYNRVDRSLERYETTASWTYTTATVRQANGATANQVDILQCLADGGSTIDLSLLIVVQNSNGAAVNVSAGIGEDATTTYVWGNIGIVSSGSYQPIALRGTKVPTLGRHFYSWNEWSTATATTTWFATTVAVGSTQTSGLSGKWFD